MLKFLFKICHITIIEIKYLMEGAKLLKLFITYFWRKWIYCNSIDNW